jgi:capsular polysaccharide biosynthesis protein
VRQAEESYQLYNKKQEEARIADELDQNKITNVSIAEAPVQPQLPSKPNRPVNLLLGLALGLLLAAGSVVTVELLRETVNTPRELESLFGSPVLAALPKDRAAARRALIIEKPRLALPKAPAVVEAKFGTGD